MILTCQVNTPYFHALSRMLARMLRRTFPLSCLVLLLVAPLAWAQGIIEKVHIEGLDKRQDAEMIENIEAALSLFDILGKEQSASRLEWLVIQAQRQTRKALEPFGYYNPVIDVSMAPQTNGQLHARIHVDKGEEVRVRQAAISITGPASRDRYLRQDLQAFRPREGERFHHPSYEESKLTISRRLHERGYFDADPMEQRVEITRADNAADLFLRWDSGRRYNMGPMHFHQDYFRPVLFERLVYWDEGSYWHAGKLERLRESLTRLDYFSVIDMQPDPDAADSNGNVPVDVYLTPAKRTIYTAGISYGTESGPGLRAGLERRFINKRGHKMELQSEYARKRRSHLVSYRVPAFDWLDGWYSFTLSRYEERIRYIDLINKKWMLGRSGQLNEKWNVILSVNRLQERWRYGQGSFFAGDYDAVNALYPQISADYRKVDDRLFPRDGFMATINLRAGLSGLGSDTNFMQGNTMMRWLFPAFEQDRLILRSEVGHTWVGRLVAMPPSLRYFAGGDLSVRGYGHREIGPRTPAPDRFATGAQNLLTGSIEYEHYFAGGPWGMALFADTGSAFDSDIVLRSGAGLGLRWKSPLGPLRIDVAHGFDQPDSPFQIYLNIGAER